MSQPFRSALISMPSAAQLGGAQQWPGSNPSMPQVQPFHPQQMQQAAPQAVAHQNPVDPSGPPAHMILPPPWVRVPFFPTAPWVPTNPNVGFQTRFYSASISSADSDYSVGTEAIRPIQFDIPCRVIAINGAAQLTTASVGGGITEVNMNTFWMLSITSSMGDKLTQFPQIAATIVGTGRNPGEIGGAGYNVDQGSTLQIGFTPLLAGLRIALTLVCLEMRAPVNFSVR